MKKIYIVTSGEYSRYKIDGVFDCKEKADQFMKTFSGDEWDKPRIEIFELNPFSSELSNGLKPYFLRIEKSGEIVVVVEKKETFGFTRCIDYDGISYTIGNRLMNLYCMAKNETHAKKIIREKWSQVIALDRWGYEHKI